MNELNWTDPEHIEVEPELEDANRYIRNFFETTWFNEEFDDMRNYWQKEIEDEHAKCRSMAKTAAWAVVRMRYEDIENEFTNILNR